ncbi:helix-turn-helix transcriptional regulator [Isoptericola sp. 4D.3]|uniref:Helix-turn-helix transcriptional regulator n=1 Tax=Isoptericola peretonis TaxID=2918523 RepID=A0ABT0J6R6_9MICO|nr:helix-turn-helix transcriptional regulator [Isoptericola sp. 4D.3]
MPPRTSSVARARPVAPQVVRRVSALVGGDREALAQTLGQLTPHQLAGSAVLPDPLPVTPAVREAVRDGSSGTLDDEARRVLLAAGVLVVDRVDVLLGATGVPVERLLAPPVAQHLELVDGRFRVVDPRVRAVVHEDADLAGRTTVHAALAAELDRAGEADAARWHAALATLAGDPGLADGLVGLAERRLEEGSAVAAHAVAREAASHGTGDVRARAFLVAGRAALLAGYLHTAAGWFDRATSTGATGVQGAAARAGEVVRALSGVEAGAPTPDDAPPGRRLARLVVPVVRTAVSSADRAALVAVVDALARLDLRPRDADAVLARAVVTAVPHSEQAVWPTGRAGLTPLAEAHLRVVQALVLLRGGDAAQAARVLDDAAGRLPVTHVAGGLAAEVARCVDGSGSLAASLRAAGPGPAAPARAVCRDHGGARSPETPSLMVSAVRRCRGPDDRPGGDVWARWAGVLTARELDVARLVADGLANKQVADRLCVSVRTVEVHLGRVFRKVGVSSRGELTVVAHRRAS